MLKAAVFTPGGRVLARAARGLRVQLVPEGGREQDAQALLRAVGQVVGEVRRTLGPTRWRQVAGVGLASQGGSGLLVESGSGRPLGPMQLWNDARAFALLPEVTRLRPPVYWRQLAWREGPGAGLARMLWWQRQRPDLWREAGRYVGAGEFVFHRLTGEYRQDAGNALQIGCYDADRQVLAEEPLALVGASLSRVAPLRRGHETAPLSTSAAAWLGLAEGTPVAGPYIDQEAGYQSALGLCRRPLHVSLGTAWVGNFVLPAGWEGGSPFQLVLPSPAAAGRLVVQPLLTGNTAWDWGLAQFVDRRPGRALARLPALFAQRWLPPAGLVAVPWLNRPNPWCEGALGGGAFLGVSPTTTRDDLLRALAAGLVFELARVFEPVRDAGVVDAVVLGGGASRSEALCRFAAALFAPLPVLRPADEDACAARGALLTFGVDASEAAAATVPPPVGAELGEVRSRYAQYVDVYGRLCGHVAVGAPFDLHPSKETRA